jgi:hypothetical protein
VTRANGVQDGPLTAGRPCEGRPDFLAHTRLAFAAAAEGSPSGVETIDLRFAGRPVRLRVAGPLLASQLRRSYRMLIADDAGPSGEAPVLTMDAWDREHTGIGCPGVPYAPEATDALGGGLVTQFGGGTVIRFERANAVSALDRASAELFHCVRSADGTEVHLRSKPFPELLATWYRDRGVHQLHAGLVARDGRGVLFVGSRGSGKTTSTVACSLAGFDFLGDDHVGVEIWRDGALGHAFYACIRADDDLAARFPGFAAARLAPIGRWEHKGMVCMAELQECRMARATRIEAIVMPEVRGGGPTRLAAVDRATVLRRLAPSTLLVPLGSGARGLGILGELVRRVPGYRLEIGDSARAIPLRIGELLAGLA